MKVLIVGGTGLIGGHCALLFQKEGHHVTLMARKPAAAPSLAGMEFLQGDYINDDFSAGQLNGFDAVIFSAAADIRHIPYDGSVTYAEVNDVAVPRFAQACKDAGVASFILINTFYPHVAPEKIGECPYVTSRYNTDVNVRALNSDDFKVCSLGAPFILGHIPGLAMPYIDTLVQYAKGNIPDLPLFAPEGGTNHMSAHSLAQATLGALLNGTGGRAYLIGDENYTWQDYLQLWFTLAGNPQSLPVLADEHPLFPNMIMFAGVGAEVNYQPDPEDLSVLNYNRNQMAKTIAEIVSL